MLAVRVKKGEAEAVRRDLLCMGVLDKSRRITEEDGFVEIPVTEKNGNYAYVERGRPVYYRERLSFKGILESLKGELNRGEMRKIRGGWELIGEVLVLRLPEELDHRKKRLIAEGFLDYMPRVKAVLNRRGIEKPFREPRVEVLYGRECETVHKENGCRFKIDPSKVMFSAGNQGERRRMSAIAGRDEVVLDMFAGIGQFTVPIARHSRPKKVLAIEKNPAAHGYLVENIKLNGLVNVTPILGDCCEKSPRSMVNRVIMGYFYDTMEFLPHALAALDGGGVVHFHALVERRWLEEKAVKLEERVKEMGYSLESIKPRIVKSYSPSRYHAVFDMEVK